MRENSERTEQRGELSTLPTRTGILWKLHVSDLNSPADRTSCSLGGQTIIPSPSQRPSSEGLSSVIPQPKNHNQPKYCEAKRSSLQQFDASLLYKRAFGGSKWLQKKQFCFCCCISRPVGGALLIPEIYAAGEDE